MIVVWGGDELDVEHHIGTIGESGHTAAILRGVGMPP